MFLLQPVIFPEILRQKGCAAIVWYPLFMKSYIFHDVYSIADVKHPQNSLFVSAGMDSYCFKIWGRQSRVMKRRNELTERKTSHVQGRRIRKRQAAMTLNANVNPQTIT